MSTANEVAAAIAKENARLAKSGGPAFMSDDAWRAGNMGLTKREYMATALMAGMLAGRGGKHLDQSVFQIDAKWAVAISDALLAELAK